MATNSTTSLQGALPPVDRDAEQAILGSVLLNSKIMDEVADQLKEEYFYDPRHSLVYKTIVQLWSASFPVDVLSVANALTTNSIDKLAESINQDFLLELISKVALSSSPTHTAGIIKDKFMLRSLMQTGDKIKSSALENKESPIDILEQSQKMLYELSVDNVEKSFVSITEVLAETFERISELHNSEQEFRGVPTGLIDLDKVLGGLHPSDLVILAARPSMGKTSLTLEICKRVATLAKQGVAIFSLEMSRDQLCEKMLSSASGISLSQIRTGNLSEDPHNNEFQRLAIAMGQLDQSPIFIDDSGSLNILELRTKARRLKSRFNIGLLVIDYLQLMSGNGSNYKGNRVQEVSDISRSLKILAKDLNIPILALSQLSRAVDSRDDKRPMLSDLRESGSIEQDADVVLFVHREEMYHKDTKKKGIADILISKHRNGQTGSIELAWVPRLATFDNLHGARTGGKVNE
jgi:replicative DNA helicase